MKKQSVPQNKTYPSPRKQTAVDIAVLHEGVKPVANQLIYVVVEVEGSSSFCLSNPVSLCEGRCFVPRLHRHRFHKELHVGGLQAKNPRNLEAHDAFAVHGFGHPHLMPKIERVWSAPQVGAECDALGDKSGTHSRDCAHKPELMYPSSCGCSGRGGSGLLQK